MRLTAHPTGPNAPAIVPTPHQRGWMEASGYAYRCLPLVQANRHGWVLLNPSRFEAVWDGGAGADAVTVKADGPCVASSHFGFGVLTFDTGHLFRTDAGHNLLFRGVPNWPKDGISPLEGLVETDWLPYTATMNWRFTRPSLRVVFDEGEPFCFLCPTPRGYLESFEPDVRPLDADPTLQSEYLAWGAGRAEFDRRRVIEGTPEHRAKWKQDYVRGTTATGAKAPEHETKIVLKGFERSE